MSGFNVDEEGSFGSDDGYDLDAMLASANEGAEDAEDSSRFFSHDEIEVKTPVQQPVMQEVQQFAPEVTFVEVEQEDTPTPESFSFEQNSYAEPVQEEHIVEDPVIEEPVEEDEPEQVYEQPEAVVYEEPIREEKRYEDMHIPSNHVPLGQIAAVIRVLDVYRSLSADKQETSSRFVLGGKIAETEADFVSAVLSVDQMLPRTMSTLTEANDKEPVDRAFFVIDLEDALMYSVGDLMPAFGMETIDRNQPKSQYARKLVRSIEKLDPTAMEHVAATARVLKAATDKD